MANGLIIPGFIELRGAEKPYAIYCLCLQGEIVYIGKSTNIYSRVGKHWQNMTRVRAGKPPYAANDIRNVNFDQILVKFVEKDELDLEEFNLIQRHMPKHNRHFNRKVPDFDPMKIPAIAEIMRRVERRRPVPFQKRDLRRAA